MEAIGKYDFSATSSDELSFSKGAKLKILCTHEDKNWYKAELDGRVGLIPSNYIEPKPDQWFIPQVWCKRESEDILLEKNGNGEYIHKDGAFLVRSCRKAEYFILSVKFGDTVQHLQVLQENSKYFLDQVKFDSLDDLIKYYRTAPLCIRSTQTVYLQDMTRPKVIANYDFKPETADELEMKRGDIISVLNRLDPNWWMGEIVRDTQITRGLFPKSYVSRTY